MSSGQSAAHARTDNVAGPILQKRIVATGFNLSFEGPFVNFKRAFVRLLSVLSLGALLSFSSSASAIAGAAQIYPLSYLQQIFDQQSILDETNGQGIAVDILPTQTIWGPTRDIGPNQLNQLVQISGLANTLVIPIFYVDGYQSAGTLGLGYVGNNGTTILTSYQETLQVHPDEHDYATCTADHGVACYYDIPEVTPSDIPLGWLASATVLAHEIGHNLGLQHTGEGLMDPYATPYSDIGPSAYALTDAQVLTILASPLVQTFAHQQIIQIAPFSVFAIPEPETWTLMIAGMALVGAALRRRSSHRQRVLASGTDIGPHA